VASIVYQALLFGLLKMLVTTRKPPLKLVITSATLESEKFSLYFNECPVYHVPGGAVQVDSIKTRVESAHSFRA